MLRDIRNNYQQAELFEEQMNENPIEQFKIWLNEAVTKNVNEPTATVLSTVDGQNMPQARIVLLKDITDRGFVFFTNYGSAKAKQISTNKFASLTFFWAEIERQVRINGQIEKVGQKLSDEYFASRPVESQLGAWASPQSQVISSKKVLDDNFQKYSSKFGNKVPRPKNWGGYLIVPLRIEFWQGRPNRLHDRICYQLEKDTWKINRLAP